MMARNDRDKLIALIDSTSVTDVVKEISRIARIRSQALYESGHTEDAIEAGHWAQMHGVLKFAAKCCEVG